MDALFGWRNFVNEVLWLYKTGGMSKRWFGRKHDNILFYAKGREYVFNPQREKSYLSHKYGFSNVKILQDGQGIYTMVGMRDYWDIPALRGNQPETVGYPTQKPVALYERIISASSNNGDIVLDPFAGCATTLVAAERVNGGAKRDHLGGVIPSSIEGDSFRGFPSGKKSESMRRTDTEVRHGQSGCVTGRF